MFTKKAAEKRLLLGNLCFDQCLVYYLHSLTSGQLPVVPKRVEVKASLQIFANDHLLAGRCEGNFSDQLASQIVDFQVAIWRRKFVVDDRAVSEWVWRVLTQA